jgi:DNA-binding response OmpR family regulator
MRIAVLDDDTLQLDLIKQATEAMGHVCHTHLCGASLLRELRRETFDLLIVDWHLPDTTGPEIVRWVRKNVGNQIPILFVTHRQEERDIMEGLGSGADDFMTKPVRIGELRARISALLRRAYPGNTGDAVEFGRYRFLPETHSIEIDGKPVELKNREYDLALFLFQNMGRLLSRDHLKEIVWGQASDVMSRSLDTHISRLRALLDLRPVNGFIITAVYGVGYRFEAVEAQQKAGQAEGGIP